MHTRPLFLFLFLFLSIIAFSQDNDPITVKEIARLMNKLAGDSMMGRGNGTNELLAAGIFIGDEFRKSGLHPMEGENSFFLAFRPFGGSKKNISDNLKWNEDQVAPEQFMYLHPQPGNYPPKRLKDFATVARLKTAVTPDVLEQYLSAPGDELLWTRKQFDRKNALPPQINMPAGGLKKNVLLVYADSSPDSILLSGVQNYYANTEYNVVGVLPGKSKPDEIVVFSAHYDHEGVYPTSKDSIMNGANDDASGVAALLALANYFSKRNDNERTIMFCAFAGEELGLLGSKEFVKKMGAGAVKIAAVINIEMIGIPQYGKNTVVIPGEKFSDLPAILRKGFASTIVKVRKEPDVKKDIYKRSDNYSFAEKGIPAHAVMASDDNDPCYHKPCDEVKRIDMANMTTIIKAIAKAAMPLISGKETPTMK